jgi:beta-glucosidase
MKLIKTLLSLVVMTALVACQKEEEVTVIDEPSYLELPYMNQELSVDERIDDLMSRMTLVEKVAQMIQGERNNVKYKNASEIMIGSVLSGGGSTPNSNTIDGWKRMIKGYQNSILDRELPVPLLYGIDAVHGHNNVLGATIFPQNIGLGAANDQELMIRMGEVVGEEMLLTNILWNFSPTVALAMDQRWGRSYESFSTDADIVTDLSVGYATGLLNVGVIPTAKHFIGDGGTIFGTGLDGKLDRGNTEISDEEIREVLLKPYEALIDLGVPVVMASYSSINGTLMHEHGELINGLLKDELGFDGFVVSDWEAIHAIEGDFKTQVEKTINAGVDMLMEPSRWYEAYDAILFNVEAGKITEERIDDAVRRILKVKFEFGLFEDPTQEAKGSYEALRSDEAKEVARSLVEKSMVLLKNDNVLPLNTDQKVLLVGPGIDDIGMQSGGWTIEWQGSLDHGSKLTDGVTIREGFESLGFDVYTDQSKIDEVDVVVMVIGEKPYSEMQGDIESLDLENPTSHPDNRDAIEFVKTSEKPVVTVMLAGRHLNVSSEMNDWDAFVMAYLPGSEGDGVVNTLVGNAPFTGKLPMSWMNEDEILFEKGFGLEN